MTLEEKRRKAAEQDAIIQAAREANQRRQKHRAKMNFVDQMAKRLDQEQVNVHDLAWDGTNHDL